MLIRNEIVEFLRTIPPFQFLDDQDLSAVARDASLEFFPRGSMVISPHKPAQALHIIKKGAVKLFISRPGDEGGRAAPLAPAEAGDGEITLDYRGDGELFGYLSMISGERSRTGVRALEDTLCYLVDRRVMQELVQRRPDVSEYFLSKVYAGFMDKTFDELRRHSAASGGLRESMLYAMPAAEAADRDFARGPLSLTIRQAAEIMTRAKRSALVLLDDAGLPAGIVTDTDFRAKVLAAGVDPQAPASSIMSSPVVSVRGGDLCLEAMLTMIGRSIHHVPVVDHGRVAGLLSSHDVMMLQGLSPLTLLRKIEGAGSLEELQNVSSKMNELVGLLLEEGAKASAIARIVAGLNDQLFRRVFSFAHEKLGPAPLPYCFIVFGSEGRKEQSYKTDQDNALIYADAEGAAGDAAAQEYFGRLGSFVAEALKGAGFPPCPAGYMLSSPAWRKPLKAWKKLFSSWTAEPSAEALLGSMIFFDFRPVCGDVGLARELRDHLNARLAGQRVFFGHLAQAVVRNRPPVGFLKGFIVEKGGEHKDALNIKVKGLAPLVDLVRFFALEKGVAAAATTERIAELAEPGEGREPHAIVRDNKDELLYAFEFLLMVRMTCHKALVESGKAPDNWIKPAGLSNLEKKSLKQSFALIADLQDLLAQRYKEFIW